MDRRYGGSSDVFSDLIRILNRFFFLVVRVLSCCGRTCCRKEPRNDRQTMMTMTISPPGEHDRLYELVGSFAKQRSGQRKLKHEKHNYDVVASENSCQLSLSILWLPLDISTMPCSDVFLQRICQVCTKDTLL